MMPLRYLQLDVFAARPGAGNPLGAVIEGARFDPSQMQAFAAWTNLSETIFLLPSTTPDADYRVRIFTPRQELPFAGHPSVGAAWAALDAGLVAADKTSLVQECAAGLLPVEIQYCDVIVTFHMDLGLFPLVPFFFSWATMFISFLIHILTSVVNHIPFSMTLPPMRGAAFLLWDSNSITFSMISPTTIL